MDSDLNWEDGRLKKVIIGVSRKPWRNCQEKSVAHYEMSFTDLGLNYGL